MQRRRHLGGKIHLLLFTWLLIITDVVQGQFGMDDMVQMEEVGYGGIGGEEETLSRAVEGGGEEMGGGGGGGGVVAVENGTMEAVVLDCPYHFDDKDMNGIHINWYHSSIASPVYAWIPGREPSALWFLRDRVDLSYEASQDPNHRHRALRILEPTTDVAGRYVCRVSSFSVELEYPQELVVFIQPSLVNISVEEREEGEVAVYCMVGEVYPQPLLHLYKKSSMEDSEVISGGSPVISSSRGTYSMEVEKVVKEDTLDGPTEFECQVKIPNTEVRFTASTMYQPRVSVATGAVTGAATSTQRASAVVLVVLSLTTLLQLLL